MSVRTNSVGVYCCCYWVCCRINQYLLFVCHLGRTNHCDFFRTLEVGGREANKYSHVYDNFSVHGQLLSFFYLIMIDVQVVGIVETRDSLRALCQPRRRALLVLCTLLHHVLCLALRPLDVIYYSAQTSDTFLHADMVINACSPFYSFRATHFIARTADNMAFDPCSPAIWLRAVEHEYAR